MGYKTGIEWTDATWTPIRARAWDIDSATGGGGIERVGWHCETVSEGCRNCYAQSVNLRLGTQREFKPGNLEHRNQAGDKRGSVTMFLDAAMMTQPLRWLRPRMIFVCSMTDLFAHFVPDAWIDQMMVVMALSPQHVFQVLTKRPERMRDYMARPDFGQRMLDALAQFYIDDPDRARRWPLNTLRATDFGMVAWPLPNVWMGVSVEDQDTADARIPVLLETRAALRFLSMEPLLGPVSLGSIQRKGSGVVQDPLTGRAFHETSLEMIDDQPKIDWIITGGESGPNARPMHSDWIRHIEAQAQRAHCPHVFKQWGEWARGSGFDKDGILQPAKWVVLRDGRRVAFTEEAIRAAHKLGSAEGSEVIRKTGKKEAGRDLDGVTLDGYPKGWRA